MEEADGAIRCVPAELRLPAGSNVELTITNTTKNHVTLTAPRQFENRHVLHHDGDLVHVASNDGYLIKQNEKGMLRIRTLDEGNTLTAAPASQAGHALSGHPDAEQGELTRPPPMPLSSPRTQPR